MTTLMIELTEEQMELLTMRAQALGISPQELLQAGVEQLLAEMDEDLRMAVEYTLEKNAELYRRLA